MWRVLRRNSHHYSPSWNVRNVRAVSLAPPQNVISCGILVNGSLGRSANASDFQQEQSCCRPRVKTDTNCSAASEPSVTPPLSKWEPRRDEPLRCLETFFLILCVNNQAKITWCHSANSLPIQPGPLTTVWAVYLAVYCGLVNLFPSHYINQGRLRLRRRAADLRGVKLNYCGQTPPE